MVKVAVIGAAGGIGQSLSLLLKNFTNIDHLALSDVVPIVKGVAADLGHIPTKSVITAHVGADEQRDALKGANLVVIPAGVPRKPGMTRDDLNAVNASILGGIAKNCAVACPDAFYCIITNPVNNMIPMFVEILAGSGIDRKKAERQTFGITQLDMLRARVFLGAKTGADPSTIDVPVVGGHAGTTIVPLFSQAKPFGAPPMSEEEHKQIVVDTQDAGTKIVEARAACGWGGSATLSMAVAAAEFVKQLMPALNGTAVGVYAYVRSDVHPGTEYFATKVHVGRNGIILTEGLGPITAFEHKLLEPVAKELAANVAAGKAAAAKCLSA